MRVGTRPKVLSVLHPLEDHPHACGDKLVLCAIFPYKLGSSPCVWGQDDVLVMSEALQRIIPMRVGTRLDRIDISVRFEDHPHACGDKKKDIQMLNPLRGSSPCVWGQVCASVAHCARVGIIPMRVGTR